MPCEESAIYGNTTEMTGWLDQKLASLCTTPDVLGALRMEEKDSRICDQLRRPHYRGRSRQGKNAPQNWKVFGWDLESNRARQAYWPLTTRIEERLSFLPTKMTKIPVKSNGEPTDK